MHTVAIISRKGGAGKTTIAVHLAAAAEQAGRRTAILDLDQQHRPPAGPISAARPGPKCTPAFPTGSPAPSPPSRIATSR